MIFFRSIWLALADVCWWIKPCLLAGIALGGAARLQSQRRVCFSPSSPSISDASREYHPIDTAEGARPMLEFLKKQRALLQNPGIELQ
ncbi:hypothetical protein [Sinorhizobium fredii]|uniref:hypothetical protein n=1 Tax=Rhizobium fredii TaxID=380 RepID=UPI0012FE0995|nr:hypothetical protein [Sinorhizobium fredii]